MLTLCQFGSPSSQRAVLRWFFWLAEMFPASRRGAFFGGKQALAGPLSVGAALLVQQVPGGGGQGPWGGRGGGGGGNPPPDLEEMLRRSQDKLKSMIPGGGSAGKFIPLILIIVAGVLIDH